MRIPSFSISNQRAIGTAQCDPAPPLMLIAGPNGSGKSTLLNALRQHPGGARPLYVGPHRNSRRQQVQYRNIIGQTISLEQILASQELPGYEGISLSGGPRDAWNSDESLSYVKHSLCQIEIERQQAIAARYDRDKKIEEGAFPDPWTPLRELTSNLLPHLSFSRIDTTNRTQVKCLWQVHGRSDVVDLDDLSSGEKSVVQMFFPLVEHRLRAILTEMRGEPQTTERQEVCVLIDEPELHLHPNLQLKVYDYFRLLVSQGKTQIILASHSTTLVEYATFEELFLLRPVELVGQNENQLIRVASDEDRLQALRSLYGSTSNLTAMQPIIVVEGTDGQTATRVVPDRKLYRAVYETFDRVTLISGGGKGECIKLRKRLQEALAEFSKRLPVLALLDRDLSEETPDDQTAFLPVSMIENFLLDPDAIWEAIQSVVEKTSFKSVEDVGMALDKILDRHEQAEVERRVLRSLGPAVFRAQSPVADIEKQVATFIDGIRTRFTHESLKPHLEEARKVVTEIDTNRKRRELYDGKSVLEQFYRDHLHKTGLAKIVFIFETARHARRRKSVQEFFNEFFRPFSLPPQTDKKV
jgi:hypothetical protein